MTPREHAAFNAGIETARQMALTAAAMLEVRDDAASTATATTNWPASSRG